MAEKEKTIISDLRLVCNGDQWGAVAELENGTEVPVWAVNGNDEWPPEWLKNEKVYERWYNLALEEAHRWGFWLEGEVSEEEKETWQKAKKDGQTRKSLPTWLSP